MKRLVICCDGTWQELKSPYPTNVVKIALATRSLDDAGTYQIVFYDEGVGTEMNNKFFGGGLGRGLDANILEAYRFLSLNYCDGDEIYLFGFSRGAYTVRSLGGLINKCSIIRRENIRKIPQAFDLYRDRLTHPEEKESETFRTMFSHSGVTIRALCCWDTVGSLGIPDQIPFLPIDNMINRKFEFHDTKLSKIIKNAFHAVSLDERRKVFNTTVNSNSMIPS